MSFLKVKAKARGRPVGSGLLRKPEDKATVPCKITPKLANFIEANKLPRERFSDTLTRMFKYAEVKYEESRKKVDALEERLQEIRTQSILYTQEPNKL